VATPKRVACPACNGTGVTKVTAPECFQVRDDAGKLVWRTIKQGSGCPRCLGVAFLEAQPARL
jgi:hypothetical protein